MRRVATAVAIAGLVALGADTAGSSTFTPADGRYSGEYTSGEHGPGKVRLRVEPLRPGLPGVKLLEWSGQLRCGSDETQTVSTRMSAGRAGRTFSGTVTYTLPPGKDRFAGRFTARDALEGTVRVKRGTGAERCDTGPIGFEAHRVGP